MKILSHPITLLLFTIISAIFFLSLDKSANRRQQSAQTISQLEKEVEVLSDNISVLGEEVEKADSALSKEKILRNELLYKKPGEYVVQIPNIEEAKELDNTRSDIAPPPIEQWKKLLL